MGGKKQDKVAPTVGASDSYKAEQGQGEAAEELKEHTQMNGGKLPVADGPLSLQNGSGVADTTAGHNSASPASRIRYQILYKDIEGAVLEKSPYQLSKPILKADPEDDLDQDEHVSIKPVLDIITSVTIRDVVATETIGTKAAAAKAAIKLQTQDGDAGKDGKDANPNDSKKTFKIRSVDTSHMVIRSKPLIEAIRAVVTYYPRQSLAGETITVYEPYYMLLQYQKEIKAHVEAKQGEENASEQGLYDFQVLQTYLDTTWKKKLEREVERYFETPATATFEMLWRLFRPGTRVITEDEFETPRKELGGYVVRFIEEFSKDTADHHFVVSLWYLTNDGDIIDRSPHSAIIRAYEGAREIRALPVYPLEIVDGDRCVQLNPKLEAKLIARGRRVWKVMKTYFEKRLFEVTYKGPILASKEDYSGRAIIDPSSYYRHTSSPPMRWIFDDDTEYTHNCIWMDEPIGSKKRPPYAKFMNITPQFLKQIELEDEQFFLLGRGLGGFTLKTRQWRMLDIAHVDDEKKPEISGNLQIPEDRLKMIKALTDKSREGSKGWSADFVQNKGEGQIFLLHGPSGVGKTYTAECIAELTDRPLLSLTCANIGTDETQMEMELSKWFTLSEQWQAIMLIDEADVYFERRASGQLQRNSLVSAFLRAMEYYHGILFLTTNRLGHIDDAILSRIHIIIEYQELSDPDREKIWQQFFAKLRRERPNFVLDDYIESYIENDQHIRKLQWNGREIRNAFQTAVALAEHEGRTAEKERIIVKKQHLEQVVKMSAAFKDYMVKWKGDAARRAYMDGARMDPGVRQLAKEKKEKFDRLRQMSKD